MGYETLSPKIKNKRRERKEKERKEEKKKEKDNMVKVISGYHIFNKHIMQFITFYNECTSYAFNKLLQIQHLESTSDIPFT